MADNNTLFWLALGGAAFYFLSRSQQNQSPYGATPLMGGETAGIPNWYPQVFPEMFPGGNWQNGVRVTPAAPGTLPDVNPDTTFASQIFGQFAPGASPSPFGNEYGWR